MVKRENSAIIVSRSGCSPRRFPPTFLRATGPSFLSPEVENIADFPGEERCETGKEAGDKQVLGHNKGVSIHGRALFICKPRGWPSVRIISSDFHDRVCPREMPNWLGKRECARYHLRRLFYRINGKFNIRYTIAPFRCNVA